MIDLSSLLNMGIIGSIIALTKLITSMDKGRKLERLYPAIPLILGIIAALFVTVPLEWQAYGANVLMLGPTAAYIYKFGKTTVLGK
jgi:hypothetical protein